MSRIWSLGPRLRSVNGRTRRGGALASYRLGFFKLSQDGGCRRRRARMARRFGAARRFAAAAVVMAMKSSGAAGSRLTTDGRSVLVKRPELLTTAVASEGSRVEAIVAYATQGSNPD